LQAGDAKDLHLEKKSRELYTINKERNEAVKKVALAEKKIKKSKERKSLFE
jgi:hypothetical protein